MTSTGASQGREQRRARHAQRVARLRQQRERQPVASGYAAVDPFAVFANADLDLAKAEEAFPL